MKRAIQVAGERFSPGAEFRKRVQQSIGSKAQRSFLMEVSGGSRHSRGRDVDFRLSGEPIRQRPGLQRDCRLARGDAGQFIAGGCHLDRSAHGKAVVPGKNPLRVQFSGTPEYRIFSVGRPDDVS